MSRRRSKAVARPVVLAALLSVMPIAAAHAQPAAPAAAPSSPATAPAAAPAAAPGYGVHLESYREQDRAATAWELVRRANAPELDGLGPHVASVEVKGERFYRLIAGPLAREQAAALCARLTPRRQYCDVVALGSGESVSAGRRALARSDAAVASPATTTGMASTSMAGPASSAAPVRARPDSREPQPAGGPTVMALGEGAPAGTAWAGPDKPASEAGPPGMGTSAMGSAVGIAASPDAPPRPTIRPYDGPGRPTSSMAGAMAAPGPVAAPASASMSGAGRIPDATGDRVAPDPSLLRGTWSAGGGTCTGDWFRVEAEQITLVDGRTGQSRAMRCTIEPAVGAGGALLAARCADGSAAGFEVIDPDHVVLRWVESGRGAARVTAERPRRRCATGSTSAIPPAAAALGALPAIAPRPAPAGG